MFDFPFSLQKIESYSAMTEAIGEWNNDMAAGMMPLDQEVAAFGDVMPVSTPGNNNGLNYRI